MHELMQLYPGFTEWYEVVKTVAVRMDGTSYRLEIIRRFNRQLAHAYEALLWVGVARDAPVDEWEHLIRDTTFPWIAQDTLEGALEKALALLYNRGRPGAEG
jgi:hypothetical protein